MKKVSILFASALVLGLSLTSCSKDEDNGPASLEGKWNASKEGSVIGGTEYLVDYMGNESGCSKDYVNLTSAGVFTDVDYDSTDSPCEAFTSTGTYTRSGNNITVTADGYEDTVEIMNLTSSELKIKDADGYITVYTRG